MPWLRETPASGFARWSELRVGSPARLAPHHSSAASQFSLNEEDSTSNVNETWCVQNVKGEKRRLGGLEPEAGSRDGQDLSALVAAGPRGQVLGTEKKYEHIRYWQTAH